MKATVFIKVSKWCVSKVVFSLWKDLTGQDEDSTLLQSSNVLWWQEVLTVTCTEVIAPWESRERILSPERHTCWSPARQPLLKIRLETAQWFGYVYIWRYNVGTGTRESVSCSHVYNIWHSKCFEIMKCNRKWAKLPRKYSVWGVGVGRGVQVYFVYVIKSRIQPRSMSTTTV